MWTKIILKLISSDEILFNCLFNIIHNLTDAKHKIMLSNADVSLVRDNFANEKYNTISILCKRSINSKNPNAKAMEVIIKNY